MNDYERYKMTKDNSPVTVYESGNLIEATHREIHLKTIDHVRLEMAKVYRDMKSQSIPTSDGTRLVYVLGQIGKMIELFDIEKRVEKLEAKNESRK
jgi:hypothetical protein